MERSEKIVIDASVAIKWFSEEEGSDRALAIRNEHIEGKKVMAAPDLLVYEVANALRFKPSYAPLTTGRAMDDLFDLQLDLMVPSKDVVSRCSELAFKYGITVYDSCYLALGELLGSTVVTADNQLYNRARECGFLRSL